MFLLAVASVVLWSLFVHAFLARTVLFFLCPPLLPPELIHTC